MSKIGNTYSYRKEKDMLKVARSLEKEGFKVKKYYDDSFNNYKVKIIGYK